MITLKSTLLFLLLISLAVTDDTEDCAVPADQNLDSGSSVTASEITTQPPPNDTSGANSTQLSSDTTTV